MIHSIRARLTAWYSAVLAVVLIAFGAVSYGVTRSQISATADEALVTTARELAAALSNETGDASGALGEPATEVLLDFRYSDQPIFVFSPDGKPVASSSTPGARTLDLRPLRERIMRRQYGFSTISAIPGDFRLFTLPARVLGRPYVVAVGRSMAAQERTFEQLRRSMLLAIPLALLAAALGGYLLARQTLAPVSQMSRMAREIGADRLEDRIPVANPRDELGELAQTLNGLLERLHQSFQLQRRFMADASHELRTPVSILQGELDVTLARENREAREYRDSMEIMRRSVRKLTRIVRDLFLIARTDAGQYPVRHGTFFLDEVVTTTVHELRTLAAERGVRIVAEHESEMALEGDEDLIQRMLANLIENAIKYTPAGGEVFVIAAASNGCYRLTVRDTGIGIEPESQPRVFERFYRGDLARAVTVSENTRGSGAGLGLPIARWVADAHGGTISLLSSSEKGSTFEVVLPR